MGRKLAVDPRQIEHRCYRTHLVIVRHHLFKAERIKQLCLILLQPTHHSPFPPLTASTSGKWFAAAFNALLQQNLPLAEVIRSSSPPASTWLRWSFGQPGLPQSFFISREVFGTPIRAQHVFESGNT